MTRNQVLAKSPRMAIDILTRTQGMIGRKFDGFDAMIFPQCSSIHTYFMQQDLDVIFVDADKKVLSFEKEVKPWRVLLGPKGTETVIELPSRALCEIPMECHDILSW